MPSPAGPYKTAQEAALRASAALQSAMGGKLQIFTEVPPSATLPYVVLGNDQVLLENGDCGMEAEVTSTVTWWSRTSPFDKGVQARAMGAAIIDALNLQLAVTGWAVDEWEVQSEQYLTDPDQSTKGIVQLRHLLTQQV